MRILWIHSGNFNERLYGATQDSLAHSLLPVNLIADTGLVLPPTPFHLCVLDAGDVQIEKALNLREIFRHLHNRSHSLQGFTTRPPHLIILAAGFSPELRRFVLQHPNVSLFTSGSIDRQKMKDSYQLKQELNTQWLEFLHRIQSRQVERITLRDGHDGAAEFDERVKDRIKTRVHQRESLNSKAQICVADLNQKSDLLWLPSQFIDVGSNGAQLQLDKRSTVKLFDVFDFRSKSTSDLRNLIGRFIRVRYRIQKTGLPANVQTISVESSLRWFQLRNQCLAIGLQYLAYSELSS